MESAGPDGHREAVVSSVETNLLFAVIQALPMAAAVVDPQGRVIAMNGRYQTRRASGVADEGLLLDVPLLTEGHRLLLEAEAAARPLAVASAVRRYRFTRRETEVLEHLLDGLSSRTIAARLDLGVRTVESHVARLLEKSGCDSRGELIARVFQSMPETRPP
jgi:DNA-binding NarL/FixJ family response regulator